MRFVLFAKMSFELWEVPSFFPLSGSTPCLFEEGIHCDNKRGEIYGLTRNHIKANPFTMVEICEFENWQLPKTANLIKEHNRNCFTTEVNSQNLNF